MGELTPFLVSIYEKKIELTLAVGEKIHTLKARRR